MGQLTVTGGPRLNILVHIIYDGNNKFILSEEKIILTTAKMVWEI